MHAGIGHQRGAHGLARAGQQLQRTGRNAAGLQQLHREVGDQRGLLGRLGQHDIAGGQRRRNLAGEDGQRKVPGADAHHRAQRDVGGVGEIALHLGCVVAQKVHGLAHLGHSVGGGLAGLAQQQGDELGHFGLIGIGSGLQAAGTLGRRRLGPIGCCSIRSAQRVLYF